MQLRIEVLQNYGNRCVCCGEQEPLFLQLDHVNNDGARHRRELGNRSILRWAKKNNYPKTIQILCANCNSGKERNGGVCPHVEIRNNAIGERTRDAMRHKKANGERVGTLQYGYRLKADGVQVEPDEAEQAVLSRMGELRASGLSVRAIAAELNREGFRTRRGTEWRHQYIANLIGREAAFKN